jgi:hypothetical protein
MKPCIGTLILIGLFTYASGQYFHESCDLQYNLRSSISERQKMKFGFSTYSYLKYQNTIPNILDNFQVISRIKFAKSKYQFFKNAELGVKFQAMLSGKYYSANTYSSPPIHVKLYDQEGSTIALMPALQYIKNWYFMENDCSGIQLGLAFRYNYVGSEFYHDEVSPLGYDASFIYQFRALSLQVMHSINSLYSGYRYKSEDLVKIIETESEKITLPDEFTNLSFITLSFGDSYLKRSNDQEKLIYNIYISARRNDFSNKEIRTEFSFKTLDYISGFRISYKGFMINPEFTYRHTLMIDEIYYKGNYYSVMAGYEFRHFAIRTGFTHSIFYPFSVSLASLQSGENIYQEKLIFCLEYIL